MTTESDSRSNVQVGEWLVEAEVNQLTGPERAVHLEPRTTALLLELAAHAGRVRTRDELLEAVWGDAFVGEAALTHCIWELRKAFGDDARNPTFIQTVPRRGYRLVAAVSKPPTVAVRALVCWTVTAGSTAESARNFGTMGRGPASLPFVDDLLMACEGALVKVVVEDAEGAEPSVFGAGKVAFGLFQRPAWALRFALDLQRAVAGDKSPAAPLINGPVAKVGIHLGEIEVRSDLAAGSEATWRAVVGPATTLAADLGAMALGRQILVTRSIFDVARAGAEVILPEDRALSWLAHGDYALTGHEVPIEVFEVGVEGYSPLLAPTETTHARPVGIERTVLGWRPASGVVIPQRPHWELKRKLGEGGFGEVWLTEHVKTSDQRVFKFCVEVDRLRALQREVTLFRLLKESLGWRRDITRILDWNFDEAPYFLELEYVEGGSFADWAEIQGGLDSVPLAMRLEIVAQAGEALAAAHSIGVLHKDVKPGNILIAHGRGGAPRVLLTDFGIGQLADPGRLDEAGITALGLTESLTTETHSSGLGTRLFLAPELLEGKMASIQSDIYALGVMLYQSVVGRFGRAMGTGWQREIEDPLLRDEIARCVDVTPKRRPMSALEIAERLRSLEERRERLAAEEWQREEAERTRAALAKAQRRRKMLIAVAGVAVAVAAVVTVLTVLAMDARDTADRSRNQAERLVAFMLGDLRETLQGVGRLDAMGGTAEQVLAYYAAIDVDAMDDEALLRRADALRQVGEVQMRTGDLEHAAISFAEATAVAERLVARDATNASWQASRADSYHWLGDVRRHQGDLKGARDGFSAHLDIYQQLVADTPDQREWRLELVYGNGNLAAVLAALGERDRALEHLRERLSILNRLLSEQPGDRTLQMALASSYHRIGAVLERQGDLGGALEHYEVDHSIMLELATADPSDARIQDRLATSAGYVGFVHWLAGDPALALPSFEMEATLVERLCGIDPDNKGWQRNLAIAKSKVGSALLAVGGPTAALTHFRAAREIVERLLTTDPTRVGWQRDLAGQRVLIASALLAGGGTSAALEELEPAREALRGILAAKADDRWASRYLTMVEVVRGEALERSAEPTRARLAWEAAVATIEPLARHSDEVQDLDPWTRALIGLGRNQEAQPILDRLRSRGYRAPDFVAFCRRFETVI